VSDKKETQMRRQIAAVAVVTFLASSALLAGIGANKTMYVGGTMPGLSEKAEGRLNTSNDLQLTFTPDNKNVSAVMIPYAAITEIEYGQKAGRRVGVAVMVSPLALFSKKRNHFLTISYRDTVGKDQAGVFELGKDIVRTTLTIVATRSGKELTYQDDEARKSIGGGKGKS
jgi:hypothetical protein